MKKKDVDLKQDLVNEAIEANEAAHATPIAKPREDIETAMLKVAPLAPSIIKTAEDVALKLKHDKAIVIAGPRGVQFTDLESMWRFCVAVVNSHQFKDINTPEVALIRLQAGLELGLSPIWSLTNIMVVNGRPSVWGDGALGLVLAHPECQDVIETHELNKEGEYTAVCEVHRKGRLPVIRSFTEMDAKKAGLIGKEGPWQTYPHRMLAMRARAFALRDAFADVLRGLGIVEEMRDVPAREAVKPTQQPEIVLPDEVEAKATGKIGVTPSTEVWATRKSAGILEVNEGSDDAQ